MKYLALLGIVLFQVYFLATVSAAYMPNFTLIVLVFSALSFKPALAFKLALWAGFWLDVGSNYLFGFWMLVLSLLVGGVIWLNKTGLKINRFSFSFSLVVALTLFLNLLVWLVLWASGGSFGSLVQFLPLWIWQAMLTGVVAYLAYGWLDGRWRVMRFRI